MFFKKGPVVTPALAESLIKSLDYHLVQGTTLMYCTLKLENGYTISGRSACLPTTEFNPQLGMKYSREDAVKNLMECLAFQANDMITNGAVHAAISNALNALKESKNE